MRAAVRKMGNSSGVIIPKPLLSQAGLKTGDDIEMTLVGETIILSRAQPAVRVGWEDAAREIAEAGDDALVWPEFGNEGDEHLAW